MERDRSFFFLVLALLLSVAGCGKLAVEMTDSGDAPATVSAAIALGSDPSGEDLPEDYCYALQITGQHPDLNRSSKPLRKACDGRSRGLGKVLGFFEKGQPVMFEIPRGPGRHFELLAIPKDELNGESCASDLLVTVYAKKGLGEQGVAAAVDRKQIELDKLTIYLVGRASLDLNDSSNVEFEPIAGNPFADPNQCVDDLEEDNAKGKEPPAPEAGVANDNATSNATNATTVPAPAATTTTVTVPPVTPTPVPSAAPAAPVRPGSTNVLLPPAAPARPGSIPASAPPPSPGSVASAPISYPSGGGLSSAPTPYAYSGSPSAPVVLPIPGPVAVGAPPPPPPAPEPVRTYIPPIVPSPIVGTNPILVAVNNAAPAPTYNGGFNVVVSQPVLTPNREPAKNASGQEICSIGASGYDGYTAIRLTNPTCPAGTKMMSCGVTGRNVNITGRALTWPNPEAGCQSNGSTCGECYVIQNVNQGFVGPVAGSSCVVAGRSHAGGGFTAGYWAASVGDCCPNKPGVRLVRVDGKAFCEW